jgi:hypothetical protein
MDRFAKAPPFKYVASIGMGLRKKLSEEAPELVPDEIAELIRKLHETEPSPNQPSDDPDDTTITGRR